MLTPTAGLDDETLQCHYHVHHYDRLLLLPSFKLVLVLVVVVVVVVVESAVPLHCNLSSRLN